MGALSKKSKLTAAQEKNYSNWPNALPGAKKALAECKAMDTACDKQAASRANQAQVHAAAMGKAMKQAGHKKGGRK
jgi:hypothetical protein